MSKQIRFLENVDCYAKDEIAGFDDDLADRYVKMKVAEDIDVKNKTPESNETEAKQDASKTDTPKNSK